ncbi:MAG: type II toxin-antitoxin system RelE/ParE family toxin [Akkermansiaceae bacterium]|nr:type II toxin-antitoxin system RelE/ParE family toxin [Akkermansiaceae bacterium]
MASYQLEFSKQFHEDLKKIPPTQVIRIVAALEKLRENPTGPNTRKLVDWENGYRLRVGSYRVLYSIHNLKLVVFVAQAGHRRDIYR